MRDLSEVIDQMLEVIPAEEKDLIASMNSLRDSACYAAPEVMHLWWRKTLQVLEKDVGEPTEDWQIKLQKIFSGELE